MASYKVLIKRDVEKEIRNYPKSDIKRIVKKILTLSDDPRPKSCEKLKGREGYRIRQGPYRIVYLINDDEQTITVMKVGHRREIYR